MVRPLAKSSGLSWVMESLAKRAGQTFWPIDYTETELYNDRIDASKHGDETALAAAEPLNASREVVIPENLAKEA
jgi:hypothetical protein